jgi:alpha-glucosidase
LLVTPVLTPNMSTVDGEPALLYQTHDDKRVSGIFPGRGQTTWRDWYTHERVDTNVGTNSTLDAPLGHINVHIRDGSAILLHSQPGYTIHDTLSSPYTLLISQSADGAAFGTVYFDDGESIHPTPSTTAQFHVHQGVLTIQASGSYRVGPKLTDVIVLGTQKPTEVALNGKIVRTWEYSEPLQKLVISGLAIDLNGLDSLSWS